MSDTAFGSHGYTESDLHIIEGNVDFVRKNRRMFVRPGPVSGADLAGRVASGVLYLGSDDVTAFRHGAWWVIASTVDWIGDDPAFPVDHLFSRLSPFPQAGDNMRRPEILLTAFAQDVVMQGPNDRLVVAGSIAEDDVVWGTLTSNPAWKRALAFRLKDR